RPEARDKCRYTPPALRQSDETLGRAARAGETPCRSRFLPKTPARALPVRAGQLPRWPRQPSDAGLRDAVGKPEVEQRYRRWVGGGPLEGGVELRAARAKQLLQSVPSETEVQSEQGPVDTGRPCLRASMIRSRSTVVRAFVTWPMTYCRMSILKGSIGDLEE